MKYQNLTIIGTSHIAKQSLDDVKKAIEEDKPNIIALELDAKRLNALFSEKKDKISIYNIRRIGFKGFVFSLIGTWAEKKLGNLVGVAPGSEMKIAIKLAKENKIKIMLIDQDIEITLRRLSKSITWKEKWNFFVDIIKALFSGKKEVEFDLTKVPEKKLIKKIVGKVRKRYPNIYKVLIEERNIFMANKLKNIINTNQNYKILAIVGAGHEEDILNLIRSRDISYSFTVSH